MNNKNLWIAVIVVAIIAFIGLAKPAQKVITERIVGAVSGPDVNNRMFLNAGYTAGGNYATSTGTISAYTTSATDFASTPTVIQWTPNNNQTVTVTATSTHAYVPNVGDVAEVYFLNASTTAASAITFAAANANLDLQFVEATGGDLVLNGLDWAKVTFIRTSLYKTTMIFDEMTEAD